MLRKLLLIGFCFIAGSAAAQHIRFHTAIDTLDRHSNNHIVGTIGERLILLKTSEGKNPDLIAWSSKDSLMLRKRFSVPQISPNALLAGYTFRQVVVIIAQYSSDQKVYTGFISFDSSLTPLQAFTIIDSAIVGADKSYNHYNLLVSADNSRATLFRSRTDKKQDKLILEYFYFPPANHRPEKQVASIDFISGTQSLETFYLSNNGVLNLAILNKNTQAEGATDLVCYQISDGKTKKAALNFGNKQLQQVVFADADNESALVALFKLAGSHQPLSGLLAVRTPFEAGADHTAVTTIFEADWINDLVGVSRKARKGPELPSEIKLSYAFWPKQGSPMAFLEHSRFRYVRPSGNVMYPYNGDYAAHELGNSNFHASATLKDPVTGATIHQLALSPISSAITQNLYSPPTAGASISGTNRVAALVQSQFMLPLVNTTIHKRSPDLSVQYGGADDIPSVARWVNGYGLVTIKYGLQSNQEFIFEKLGPGITPKATSIEYPSSIILFYGNEVVRGSNNVVYTLYLHNDSNQIGIATISW